jgi:hypothetical protein
MMMESTKETYRIQYIDNTYQLVEWTDDEFCQMFDCMNNEDSFPVALIDKCIYRVRDIRTIVYLPPVPVEEQTEEKEDMVITEMGAYEQELYNLLVQNGVDLGDVLGKKGGN